MDLTIDEFKSLSADMTGQRMRIAELESELDSRKAALAAKLQEMKLEAETLDVTIPGKELRLGKKHVLNTVLDEVADIFIGMGFTIAEGPEVELTEYDFTRLNIPERLFTGDAAGAAASAGDGTAPASEEELPEYRLPSRLLKS